MVVGRKLSRHEREIVANWPPPSPRREVGGLWRRMGKLQLDFMVERGLERTDRLLDVGCGCLRGGLWFVRYLEPGRYVGFDHEPRMIEQAHRELALAGLEDKSPRLEVVKSFDLDLHPRDRVHFALAQSVFTHLSPPEIKRCLEALRRQLLPGASLYASYNEAETARYDLPYPIMSEYPFSTLRRMARDVGWRVERIGAWGHRQNKAGLQLMARFYRVD